MSNAYRDKLLSLNFRTQPAGPKVVMEGDRNEGRKTTTTDETQSVEVFIPPVEYRMDMPQFREAKEEARDTIADEARAAKVAS